MVHNPRLTRRSFTLACGAALTTWAMPRQARSQSGQSAEGFRILRAKPGRAELIGSGRSTPIWGYDGLVPGPTLRVKRSEDVRVRLVNELPEATTIHWHGLRLPNAMDGVAYLTQPPVLPGESFEYRFTPPDAGTYWYHPHFNSSEQLGRGLCGLLIVDEAEPPDVDQDIALVFNDWRLDLDGATEEASFRSFFDAAHAGRIGNVLTVNGKPKLDIPVRTNERLRLRLVNACSARLIRAQVDRRCRAVVMAVDGQPAEPFAARDSAVVLSPGARIDLFVDATLAPGENAPIIVSGYGHEAVLARLVCQAGAPARPEPLGDPKPLPANPLPERMDFNRALRIDVPIDGGAMSGMMMGRGMGGMMGRGMMGPGMMGPREGNGGGSDLRARIWTLAGRASSGHEGPPLFTIKRGRTAMLSFNNRTAFPHAMHVHGHHFRLLDKLDDGWKPFWLDTVLVMPSESTRIAFVADNPGKWVIHCHMLEHQESGMSAWFEVS